MVSSNLELEQALAPSMLPSCTITLALSNDKMSKMVRFLDLGLFKRPPWSVLPPEAMLAFVIHAADRDHIDVCTAARNQAEICGLYYRWRTMLMSVVLAPATGRTSVHGLCCC